jgi:hypothetical protein
MSLVSALLVTLAVEVPLYLVGLTALRLAPPLRAALLGVVVNMLTLPALWWALGPRPALGRVAVGEVIVWAAEAGLLWLAVRGRLGVLGGVAVVSAGANAASILVGAAISAAV